MRAGMRKYMKVYKRTISINKAGQEKFASRHGRKRCRIPAIVALALFGAMSDTYAQQKDKESPPKKSDRL